MTVFENLGFSLRLHGVAKEEIQTRVTEVARLLEIDNQLNHKPQQLSGGQRQRVALGRAIVRRPKLFLFDEPLSNLDATLRANMRVELGRLHTRLGSTMLYVTHDQAEAMTLGEKIIVLDKGRIQQIGTASEIYHQPSNLFVASFVGQPQMNFIEGRLDGHDSPIASFLSALRGYLVSAESYGPGKEIGKVPHRRRFGVSGADVGLACQGRELLREERPQR